MSQTNFEFNGQSYPFDAMDADDFERLENAVEHLQNDEKKLPMAGKQSDIIRATVEMFRRFLDTALGDGAGAAIIQKTSVTVAVDAYAAFLGFCNDQKTSASSSASALNQYGPNRAQRRAKTNA